MSFKRANVRQLLPHLYLVDDAGESTCYLICGRDRAMVIDTANGEEDLLAVMRSLTDLPLIVVNTHGHCDHIYGNAFFEEAWLHPADADLAKEHFAMYADSYASRGLRACPFRELAVGQVFELGDLALEVVDLSGHTAGSVGLLDRRDRLLFSGDGLNLHLWMQLKESLSIARLRSSILALKERFGGEFDRVLTGHARDFACGETMMAMVLRGCDELLAGQGREDPPYRYFAGVCRQHRLSEDPDQVIVYSEDKL